MRGTIVIEEVPKNRLIGPEPHECAEHQVVAYGRSLCTKQQPDRGQEGDQQGKDEQREESMCRPSCRGDLLMKVVDRLMELADLFFGDLVLRWAGGGAGAEK